MNEAKLQEIEDRANETVLRCRAGDGCDAPARWRDPSAVARPGHDEDWFCDAHAVKRVDSFRIDTVELDALDLVAEVRRMRGTS